MFLYKIITFNRQKEIHRHTLGGFSIKRLLLLLTFLLFGAVAQAATFGNASIGSTSYPTTSIGNTGIAGLTDLDKNIIFCNKYTTTVPLTVNAIRTYGTVNGSVKVSLYDNDASLSPSQPKNKLFTEVAGAVTANTWSTIVVPKTYIDPGTYWICANTTAKKVIQHSNTAGTQVQKTLAYTTAFPATLNGGGWTVRTTNEPMYFSAVAIKGYAKATKVTLSENASVLDSVALYTHATGNFRVALYDDTSGPSSKLWESSSIAATSDAWNIVNISSGTPTNLVVNAGTYRLTRQRDSAEYGPSYIAGIANDGNYSIQSYTFFLPSWAGGISSSETYSVYINYTPDTTPPTFAGVVSGTTYAGVRVGNIFAGEVIITFADETALSGATLNGAPYTSGTVITEEGNYVFTVYDTAGNSTGATFSIAFSLDQRIFNKFVLDYGYTPTTVTPIVPLPIEALIGTTAIDVGEFSGKLLIPVVLQSPTPYVGYIAQVEILDAGVVLKTASLEPFTGVIIPPIFQDPNIYAPILGTTPLSAITVGTTEHIILKDTGGNDVYAIIRMPVPEKNEGDLIDVYSSEDGSSFEYLGTTHVRLIGGEDPYITFQSNHFSVFVTVPNNGLNISADKAGNSTSSGYTTLGNIVIAEVLVQDFAPNQTNVTLILTPPSNWKFRANSGMISYIEGKDITNISSAINTTGIRITFSTNNGSKLDTIILSGIQVQAITGNLIPSTGNILRTCANPGTANMVGIVCDSTNFGSLSQIVGTAKNIITTLSGQTFIAGLGNSGTAFTQTASVSFDIVHLTTVDQFKNIITDYAGNKTISYSGPTSGTYTTSVSFTDGQSITPLTTILWTSGTNVSITATDGIYTGIASSLFNVADVPDTIPPTALIEYTPGSGTLTSGNVLATITGFSETITGLNATGHLFTDNGSFEFTFQDLAGNSGSTTATVDWIDNIAPILTQITPVPSPTNITTPSYTFRSNEPGSISYSGDCSSVTTGALSGDNTVMFNELGAGIYSNCMIKVTDTAGNVSDRLLIDAFIIDTETPTASDIIYDITGWTNTDVTATITGFNKTGITITSVGGDTHIFTESGSFEFTFQDLAGNTGSKTATVTWIDKEAPIVTVNGGTDITVYLNSSFTDNGADWTDNVDGNGFLAGATSGSVNLTVVGIYYLEYTYIDQAGNAGSATRIVEVSESDDVIINIQEANPYYIEYGFEYIEYGAKRRDTVDGSGYVTNIVSTVETNTLGAYTVTYTYVNSLGKTGSEIRDVIVQDTTPPTITLNGSSPEYVELNGVYTEQGAVRSDSPYDPGTVTNIVGSVNVGVVGTYYLDYLYTDPSGNTGSGTRTVIVQDTILPVVTDLSSTVVNGTTTQIHFTTNVPAQGFVRYGIEELSLIQTGSTGTTHTILLTGLEYARTYIYQAFATSNAGTGELSNTGIFTTPFAITTYSVTGMLIITGLTVHVEDALETGASFLTTGILIMINEVDALELELAGLSIFANGVRDKKLFPPQTESTGLALPILEIEPNAILLKTIKVGGNVGLQASTGKYFRIKIYVPGSAVGQTLKIFRSNDANTWTANDPDITCELDASHMCIFLTDHLSYFTTVSETLATTATPGGGMRIEKDSCPEGDFSASYYDGRCNAQESPIEGVSQGHSKGGNEWTQAYNFGHTLGFTVSSMFNTGEREKPLTRYDIAKMISLYAIQSLNKKPDTSKECSFDDVGGSTRIFYTTVACQLGLMGIDTTSGTILTKFEPNNTVTRAQFGTILSRLLYGETYEGGRPYFSKHMNALKKNNIIKNTDPDIQESKGRVMLMLMRTKQLTTNN